MAEALLTVRDLHSGYGAGDILQGVDLDIAPGDLIHADRHGAVVIPDAVAGALPDAIDLCTRKEAPVLAAARAPGFDIEKLKQAWGEADDVH